MSTLAKIFVVSDWYTWVSGTYKIVWWITSSDSWQPKTNAFLVVRFSCGISYVAGNAATAIFRIYKQFTTVACLGNYFFSWNVAELRAMYVALRNSIDRSTVPSTVMITVANTHWRKLLSNLISPFWYHRLPHDGLCLFSCLWIQYWYRVARLGSDFNKKYCAPASNKPGLDVFEIDLFARKQRLRFQRFSWLFYMILRFGYTWK